jgi:hypothetical protein
MAHILAGRSRGCILSTPLPALDPNYDFSELPLKLYESLTVPQKSVYDATSRFKLLCSGRRFGKTYLCITRLINWAIEKPGSLNWYVTANYRMAKQIAWRQLRHMYGKMLGKWCYVQHCQIKLDPHGLLQRQPA